MLKRILQEAVVKVNFWPFNRIYQAYYSIAVNIIVYFLKSRRGILSVYLVSSLAADDYVLGLSDIDLVIIVDENEESKREAARLYNRLSRFIPLLRHDELAVYDIAQIRDNYSQGDLWFKYKLFSGCKKNGRLLCGTDILGDFKELSGIEKNEPVLGQLAFIWQLFLKNFVIGNKRHRALMRNYLCYKLTADTCKAFISARENRDCFNRKKALEYAGEYLDGKRKSHIEKIKASAKNRFGNNDPCCTGDTYGFCVSMIQETIGCMPEVSGRQGAKDIKEQVRFDFEDLHFILSETNREKAERVVSLARGKYKGCVRSVLISPFDLLHIDEEKMCIFMIPERTLPLEAIIEMNAIIGSGISAQRLYLYLLSPEAAISLNRFEPGQIHLFIFLQQWMQVTGAYLNTPFSVLLGKPLQSRRGRKLMKDYFVNDLSGWIRENEAVMRKLMNSCDIIRLPAVEFQLFFWRALRLKLMESHTDPSVKVFMPLSSWQVYRQCKSSPSFDFEWLNDFHEEYKKDLNGLPSNSEACFQKAAALLKKMYL
ncbi:MAG: hypothetical protein WC312_06585 [Candidatus Omnitrophota bacterium]|jgi:hypothetical protein